MIEINNYYNSTGRILPKGAEYIHDTAKYFGVEMSEAYYLSGSVANNILEKALEYDYTKREFVGNIFSFFLRDLLRDKSTYGDTTFRKYCEDAIYRTKSFISRDYFRAYSNNPINNSDYFLIIDPSEGQVELRKENITASSQNSINETLYKDL
jgi:hypothetical protein